MQLSNKKVLVTGADGFIGSHLVEALVHYGCEVRAFVCYNSFGTWGWLDTLSPAIKNAIDIFTGDVRDPHGVQVAMKDCQVVMHLAALIGIPYSYHSPDTYVDTNVKGTLNVVQAARALGVEKVLHTSTSEVYGTACYVPIDENHPLQGQSPYSASKIGADQMALSFYSAFDTPVTIVRPFNTYGPRQSTRAFIPTVITQMATGASNVQLGALHPTRDFSYVKDTAQAFIDIAESDQVIGHVMNLGSNFEISMLETAQMIADLMHVDFSIFQDSQRLRPPKSEVERLWANNNKVLQLTKWRPQYGGKEGFRRGLQETIDWFLSSDNLRHYKPGIYTV